MKITTTNIFDAELLARAGHEVTYVEHHNATLTKGHAEDQGGLRGHSIDRDTFPWRVVGSPTKWHVVSADNVTMFSSECVHLAHKFARMIKRQHPSGKIYDDKHIRSITGDYDTVKERLIGMKATITVYVNDGVGRPPHAINLLVQFLDDWEFNHHEIWAIDIETGGKVLYQIASFRPASTVNRAAGYPLIDISLFDSSVL